MTKSEALQKITDVKDALIVYAAIAGGDRAFLRLTEMVGMLDEALAILTAEPSPVPPDRERNTGLVRDAESYLRQTGQTVYADAVASLLRQPAPAEVEAMAMRLDEVAYALDNEPGSPYYNTREAAGFLREAAALLRRLALPAVGDWRRVQRSKKPTIAELEEILASDHHEVRIDPDGSVWERSKPAPPIPEEPQP